MKKGILLLLCFISFLIIPVCLAQQTQRKIDSLHRLLQTAKEDTNRVNQLNWLSSEYETAGENNQSRKYSNEALSLAEKIHFEKGKAKAYINTAIAYVDDGNYPEAIRQFSQALAIGEKINDQKIIARSCNNMGLTYYYQGKYPEANRLHRRALKIYTEIADSSGMASSYNNLGIIYDEQGKYSEAIQLYFASLRIAEARGNKKAIGDAYTNIGNVYQEQGSFGDAIRNYSLALPIYEEVDFRSGIGICNAMLGMVYRELDSLDLALKYSERGFEILKANGKSVTAAETKNTIGHINIRLGRYSQALNDYSTALVIFKEVGDSRNISTALKGIGDVHFHKGEFNEALRNYNLALDTAKAVGYKTNIKSVYEAIAHAYEKKGDYKNAYLNHKLYSEANDSLLNETGKKQVEQMKAQYESEKKDNEIVLLNKDNVIKDDEIRKQRLLKFSFIGGLGLVIIMLLFGYRAYRTRQVLRLQTIRNKIAGDLHDDIGSTLNSISIYSEVARRKDGQQDEALEMIGDASRKIIDAMSDIVWTINPDNDSLSKIIFRMKSLAHNLFRAKQIEYSFHADESLGSEKLSIEERRNLYLIFKEAVNNLVKYSGATRVAITFVKDNGLIRLRIQDNGVGFNPTQEIVGNGLKNMKRRADELKAVYKMETSKGNGTQIELILKA